jgi:hypothetical protein
MSAIGSTSTSGRSQEASLTRPPEDVIEWEVDHFKRLASLREGRGFLERSTARFEGETGTVEPCDVLTPERQFGPRRPRFPSPGPAQALTD